MKALLNIKKDPHYRREAFVCGLQRHGYTIVDSLPDPNPGDLYVSWNLHGQSEALAETFRKRGGRVLVCENGAIGADDNGHQLYSIARDAHHAGTWHVGGPERWDALRIEVKPWVCRPDGEVLICAQRGIGSRLMASPPEWHAKTAAELDRYRVKNMRVRLHPGQNKKATPLKDDLKKARIVVIWSSMSGVQALVEGIPVAYYAPAWVAATGARQGRRGVLEPLRDDQFRRAALDAVAWYQWSMTEIEAGLPFEYLLGAA